MHAEASTTAAIKKVKIFILFGLNGYRNAELFYQFLLVGELITHYHLLPVNVVSDVDVEVDVDEVVVVGG